MKIYEYAHLFNKFKIFFFKIVCHKKSSVEYSGAINFNYLQYLALTVSFCIFLEKTKSFSRVSKLLYVLSQTYKKERHISKRRKSELFKNQQNVDKHANYNLLLQVITLTDLK